MALKLASTTFKPITVTQPALDEAGAEAEDLFYFDRNGLSMPYPLFVHLINRVEFTCDFLDLAKTLYEAQGRIIQADDESDFDDSADREEMLKRKLDESEKLREAEEDKALQFLEGRHLREEGEAAEPKSGNGPRTPSRTPSPLPSFVPAKKAKK